MLSAMNIRINYTRSKSLRVSIAMSILYMVWVKVLYFTVEEKTFLEKDTYFCVGVVFPLSSTYVAD